METEREYPHFVIITTILIYRDVRFFLCDYIGKIFESTNARMMLCPCTVHSMTLFLK